MADKSFVDKFTIHGCFEFENCGHNNSEYIKSVRGLSNSATIEMPMVDGVIDGDVVSVSIQGLAKFIGVVSVRAEDKFVILVKLMLRHIALEEV